MLNYTESAHTNTTVPFLAVPCIHTSKWSTDVPASLVSSYAIGPMDEAQLLTLQARLPNSVDISLLMPVHLSPTLLSDPEFKDGCEYGYLSGDTEEKWSVAQIVNYVFVTLRTELLGGYSPNVYAWTLGFLLGSLAELAERNRTLALIGIAHLCFLLSDVPYDGWPSDRCHMLHHLGGLHQNAMRGYRTRVRHFRAQGISFVEAQFCALEVRKQPC